MLTQQTIDAITSNPNPTESKYYVSKEGEVTSFKVTKCKRDPTKTVTKSVLLIGNDNFGYRRVTIKGKHESVHRLVAHLYCENPFNLSVVNHIDGNKANNCYTNLEWCTPEYNIKHSVENKLNHSGERHHNATFTEAALQKCLKDKYHPQISFKEFKLLLAPLNTTTSIMGSIYCGRSWLLVTRDYGLIHRDTITENDRVKNGERKLTFKDVVDIRQMYADRLFNIAQMAKKYNVAEPSIARLFKITSFNKQPLPPQIFNRQTNV